MLHEMPSAGCYFYHIPKTAGLSTWQLLERSYPKEKICPGRMWEDIITLPMEVLDGYDVFRGHFLAYLEPYLGRILDTFTILRDPVERTISHYYHVQRSPDHPFHFIAQSLTLAQFCVDSRTRQMVQNYQSRYLACLPWKNPRELAKSMTQEDFAAYRLQLALDPASDDTHSSEELYQAAVQRLKGFLAVGISDQLQDSLALIARRLSLPDPPVFPLRNVAPNRPANIDRDTIRTIRANTEVDQVLYEAIRRDFHQKLNDCRP
jgi:Sulfotransferase family